MNMSLQQSTLVRGCRLNVKSDIVVIFVLTQTWCPNFKLIFFLCDFLQVPAFPDILRKSKKCEKVSH